MTDLLKLSGHRSVSGRGFLDVGIWNIGYSSEHNLQRGGDLLRVRSI